MQEVPKHDKAGQLYTWGSNESGQLGTDNDCDTITATPALVNTPSPVKFDWVEANGSHSLAVSDDRSLYSWGLGSFGRLGHGDMQNRCSPLRLENVTGVVNVATGKWHGLFVTETGRLFSWGYGKSGRLGQGDELSHYRPKPVQDFNRVHFTSCSAGLSHSLAVADDGKVYSWGDGSEGKLGHGSEANVLRPKLLSTIPTDVVITCAKAGNHHTLLVTKKGEVYSFGRGKNGRLGHGTEDDLSLPKIVKLNCKVISVTAGKSHSFALTAKGDIYVWGKGRHGVLGLGASKNSDCLTPKLLPSDHTFVTVISGDTCAAALSGAIFTWGSCSFGRLGHGFVEEICWRPTRIVGAENMIFKSLAIGHYHMVAVTGKPKEQSTGQAFKSDLKRLLGMPEVSDITISINQNLFKLHSPILRVRCPQILQKDSYPELTVSQNGATNFFQFLYSGELPGWEISYEDILELWLCATVIKVLPLLHHCKILIDKMLDVDETVYLLRLVVAAGQHARPIAEQVIQFISYEREAFRTRKDDLREMKQLLSNYDKSLLKPIEAIFSEDLLPKPRTWRTLKNQKLGKLPKNFSVLLDDEDSCDFAILIKINDAEEVIHCHKAILACRSPFFAAVYRVSMAESKTGKMNVPGPTEPHGITSVAMKNLLLYLYTGSSNHLVDPINCLYILSVADYYGLSSADHHALLIHCSYCVQNSITVESCLDFYQLSHQIDVPKIEALAADFILSHYQELAEKLPYLPVQVFQRIQVMFNLRLLHKYGKL